MRIESNDSAGVEYSINYIFQPERIPNIQKTGEKWEEAEQKKKKKKKKKAKKKMVKKMNVMARQMHGRAGYYDKNGVGSSYEFSTYEVFQ